MILGGGFLRFTSLGAFANKPKEINNSIINRIILYLHEIACKIKFFDAILPKR
jgi:hypothetical protein